MSGLKPYSPNASMPWNMERAIHLYRRMGMGGNYDQIKEALAMNPIQVVNNIIDGIIESPLPAKPYWADYTYDDYENDDEYYRVREEFHTEFNQSIVNDGFRPKWFMFWHNHFVTELNTYECNRYLWDYANTIHRNLLGNFRTFVEEIGLTPAMLVYLNGNQNVRQQPNENYARELMELFTMGESNNYTQNDVVNVARALTGYRVRQYQCELPYFDDFYHDNENKTIFGQTGNYGYEDVHELIFTLRQTEVANYICEKIYQYFVYNTVDKTVTSEMASLFIQSNWELEPVIKALFQSEHFYKQEFICSYLPNPYELFGSWVRMAGITPEEIEGSMWIFRWGSYDLGADLFNPINVAGWPGHHVWLNENTFTDRVKFLSYFTNNLFQEPIRKRLHEMAQEITSIPNDPVHITTELCRYFLGKVPSNDILANAVFYFKGDIPENYYEDGSWNILWGSVEMQIVSLCFYLATVPEKQLI